jgi:hypothetical protein
LISPERILIITYAFMASPFYEIEKGYDPGQSSTPHCLYHPLW